MARATQSRNVVCITYAPLDVIKRSLQMHATSIRAYAYIYHDRFTDAELADAKNGHKEPHYHIIIRLYRSFTLSSIKRWFACVDDNGVLINTHVVPCSDVGAYYDYLIHKYDPDKYQYNLSDVTCSNPLDFTEDQSVNQDNLTDALDDILRGVSAYTIAKKYGRDFIVHSKTLFELADRINCDRCARSINYTTISNMEGFD